VGIASLTIGILVVLMDIGRKPPINNKFELGRKIIQYVFATSFILTPIILKSMEG
jgi:hypothetical protein